MNLEGRKVTVNKSVEELTTLLQSPENYKDLMPEGLQKFETVADGFKFGLKGMPEIGLKIDEVSAEKVVLKSASSSLDFALTGGMRPLSASSTEVQLLFEGNFNPFIKMMVEKPLKNFIDALTDKIEQM